MTEERKEQIVAGLKLIFFPITGFYFICKECKDLSLDEFMTQWFHYMLGVILWTGALFGIGLVICAMIYHFEETIVPVSLFVGGIFFFLILPVTIHKILNKK